MKQRNSPEISHRKFYATYRYINHHTVFQLDDIAGTDRLPDSGGPELEGRASSSYLIWQSGRARFLVDMGPGSLLHYQHSGAVLNDLDAILISHFHVDHSADLPGFIKASYFAGRDHDLPVFGPSGNQLMPSAVEFIQSLFGAKGAYRYLQDYLDGRESYRLLAYDIDTNSIKQHQVINQNGASVTAVPVHHGPVAALAWRIKLDDKIMVFSGDMNNQNETLQALATKADILVAHHAVPEDTNPVARDLHMPPSVIGQIAANASVKKLVLSHLMRRTLGREQESLSYIRRAYSGPVVFANDMQCFAL